MLKRCCVLLAMDGVGTYGDLMRLRVSELIDVIGIHAEIVQELEEKQKSGSKTGQSLDSFIDDLRG